MLEELCKRILRRSRKKKELLGAVGLKVLPVSNFVQQHATGCANGRHIYHLTMSGVVGQKCCDLLYGAKSDECGEIEIDSCTKWRFLVNTTKVFFSFSTGFGGF